MVKNELFMFANNGFEKYIKRVNCPILPEIYWSSGGAG